MAEPEREERSEATAEQYLRSLSALEYLPPFAAGMATMWLIQTNLPSIAYYTSAAAQFVKWTVLGSALSLGVCYWAGILQLPSAAELRHMSSRFLRGEAGTHASKHHSKPAQAVGQQSKHPAGPKQTHSRDSSALSSGYSGHSPSRPGSPVRAGSPARSGSPARPRMQSHETSTNVRPFVAPARDMARAPARRPDPEPRGSHKAAPGRARAPGTTTTSACLTSVSGSSHLPPLKLGPDRSPERSGYDSPSPRSASPRRKQPSASTSRRHSATSVEKPLPPIDDLPWAHEVQLGEMARADSVMSKKSVLGTTANYTTFLANVHD